MQCEKAESLLDLHVFGEQGSIPPEVTGASCLFLLLHPEEMKDKTLAKIMTEHGLSYPRKLWSLFLAERGLLQSCMNHNTKAASAQSTEK